MFFIFLAFAIYCNCVDANRILVCVLIAVFKKIELQHINELSCLAPLHGSWFKYHVPYFIEPPLFIYKWSDEMTCCICFYVKFVRVFFFFRSVLKSTLIWEWFAFMKSFKNCGDYLFKYWFKLTPLYLLSTSWSICITARPLFL